MCGCALITVALHLSAFRQERSVLKLYLNKSFLPSNSLSQVSKIKHFFLLLIPFLWPLGKLQAASVKLRQVVSFQRLQQENDNEGNAVMLWERLAEPWKSRVVALQSAGAPRNNTCCPISDLLRCEPDLSSDLSETGDAVHMFPRCQIAPATDLVSVLHWKYEESAFQLLSLSKQKNYFHKFMFNKLNVNRNSHFRFNKNQLLKGHLRFLAILNML